MENMKKQNKLLSNCCNALVKAVGIPDFEGENHVVCTMYWRCEKCKKACDTKLDKPKKIKIIPTEYEEQLVFVEWLERKNLKFSSIPNSTWTTSYNQKRKNYYSGLRPGLPDLIVLIPKNRSITGRALQLWVELKRVKRSQVSAEQLGWIEALNEVEDVEARVCRGAEEAIDFVITYLKPNEKI